MFYAHFVLSKKGPLARIWLAAHWDKKLTKAHVFETNIDSSVEAIMKPKVKLALRTSGHLLLGVVRIYSRKAKYLLADCNEAFVKIKMAFRPGVVDLPEENREAAVAAITLQENFHDFDALEDLNDIVNAPFSTVNQSRPEDITIKEDLANISFVGEDDFGGVGFGEPEANFGEVEAMYKSPGDGQDITLPVMRDKTDTSLLADPSTMEPMDVDLTPMDDNFGGDGFMGMDNDDDDDNDADSFGGGVDQDFLGDDMISGAGNLFEDTPAVPEVPIEVVEAVAPDAPKDVIEPPAAPATGLPTESMAAPTPAPGTSGEQTTLITNEEEAFALEPLDTTHMPGIERRGKRKRKLIVDEQQGIPSESMKLQLSDTTDILTTLDLAPPTKKLMHWKETGGFEKLFALPGGAIKSKYVFELYKRNLITKQSEEVIAEEEKLELDSTEVAKENRSAASATDSFQSRLANESFRENLSGIETTRRKSQDLVPRTEISTIAEESSISLQDTSVAKEQQPQEVQLQQDQQDAIFGQSMNQSAILPEIPVQFDEDGPPSIAPFSVGPASVGPPSCGPPSVAFGDDVEGGEKMPEDAEEEENRWMKRTEQMQSILDKGFRYTDELSFKDMSKKLNRKQVTSKFYTLLVLKKHKIVTVSQTEAFGDILVGKGPKFGEAC